MVSGHPARSPEPAASAAQTAISAVRRQARNTAGTPAPALICVLDWNVIDRRPLGEVAMKAV